MCMFSGSFSEKKNLLFANRKYDDNMYIELSIDLNA